ncbi:MAG TPA: rod shape-determining protein MreC, partial [Ilumatobacteraceae bacterium]
MATYSVGRRRVIIALLLTSVLLLTLDLRGNAVFDRVRTGFGYVFSPVETAARVVTRPAVNAWRGITEYDELLDENQRLQEQIDAQRGAEIAARQALVENQLLLALNDLDALSNIPTVTAQFIGESPNNLDQVIEIDRGSDHGIEVGMAVVNEAGLVGKITRVFPETSQVMLLTDSRYTVPVKILAEEAAPTTTSTPDTVPSGLAVGDVTTTTSTTTTTTTTVIGQTTTTTTTTPTTTSTPETGSTAPGTTTTSTTQPLVVVERETGALRGQGAGRLPQVTFIANTPAFGTPRVGDAVFTTGGRTSLAPPDIPVGVVANAVQRPGAAGWLLEVQPNADVSSLQ